MSNAYRDAITALEADRAGLAEKIGQIEAALTTLRNLVGAPLATPAATAPPPWPKAPTAARTKPRAVPDKPRMASAAAADSPGELATRLMQALSDRGPMGTGALAEHVKQDRFKVKAQLDSLAAKGIVHSQGQTVGQRWHLGAKGADRKPAKEAPSRRGGAGRR